MHALARRIHREIDAVRRGETAPACVYRVTLDAKGRVTRKELPADAAHRSPPPFVRHDAVPESYTALCQHHLPRPLHNAADARAAEAVMESLAGFPLNEDQADYLEALAHFVDEYDRAHRRPLPPADGRAVLRHLLAEQGLNAADLSRLLGGSRNLGAMILRGERNLTVAHLRTLSAHFGVRPEVLM